MMVSMLSWSYDFKVDGIYYEIHGTNVYVTHYNYHNSYSGNVTIPSTVTYNNTTYSVTSIGNRAFEDCSGLTSVTIPNTVTSIEDHAFYYCSGLTSINIPNSVTSIEDHAFYYCSGLTSINIPNSVTSIGYYAFYGCYMNIENVNNQSGISLENKGLTICKRTESGLCLDAYSLLKYLGNESSITIPDSVTSIGYLAFEDCKSLTSITIPSSVKSIDNYAFYGCYMNIENVKNQSGISLKNKGLTICKRTESGFCLDAYSLLKYLGNESSITIPDSVTSINNWAFKDCSGLTSVTIPNSVTRIGDNAFNGCYNIELITISCRDEADFCNYIARTDIDSLIFTSDWSTQTRKISINGKELGDSVIIPDSVTSIGDYAFYNCSELTSVTIPNSVKSIGYYAFTGCSSLITLNYNAKSATLSNIESDLTFPSTITTVNIGNNVDTIPDYFVSNCPNITSVTIPNSVKSIGNAAFEGCKGITSFTIPNSVTSIGKLAFEGCKGITSFTIPNSMTSISDNMFSNCSGLTCVTIPNSVTRIGNAAFDNCSGLTSVTIPNSVTSIGNYAFWACHGLKSFTIPNSVTNIGSYAFNCCKGLTSIVVENGNEYYDSRENCNAIIETRSNTLLVGCENTTIPNSVTSIGKLAFEGCTELISVTIPNSITRIGSSAFADCVSLGIIVCDIEVPLSINPDVFNNVDKSTCVLYVPAGCIDAYRSSAEWDVFKNIREIGDVNAISNVSINNNTSDKIYNLRGEKVGANYRGIIIKNGKKVVNG